MNDEHNDNTQIAKLLREILSDNMDAIRPSQLRFLKSKGYVSDTGVTNKGFAVIDSMNDEQHDNEIERAWERETFTLTPEQIRAVRERDARTAQTLPDVPFGDNEPAQLAAWGERATGYDAFLESIEADVLRAKLRKAEARIEELEHKTLDIAVLAYSGKLLQARIAELEAALMPFANVCSYDEDVMNAAGDEPLYTVYYGDIDDRDLVEVAYLDDEGDFHHLLVLDLRHAHKVLYGKPAPTASESEADDDDNE